MRVVRSPGLVVVEKDSVVSVVSEVKQHSECSQWRKTVKWVEPVKKNSVVSVVKEFILIVHKVKTP